MLNYRLKSEFRQSSLIQGLGLAAMKKWHNRFALPGVKLTMISPTTLTNLQNGGVVNAHAMQFLARYLNRNSVPARSDGQPATLADYDAGPYAIEVIADATDSLTTAMYKCVDYWTLSWTGLVAAASDWTGVKIDERHSVPQDEEEVRLMAAAVLRGIGGRSLGTNCEDSLALAAGERFMGKSLAAFGDWFVGLWKAEPRSLMYSVAYPRGEPPVRCGITVILPMVPAAFTALCAGTLPVFSIGASEVQYPSRYLFIFAMSDIPTHLPVRMAKNAQLLTGLYQIAMLSPVLLRNGNSPVVACVEAFPENVEKSRTFGFIPNGNRSADLGHPFGVLSNPYSRSASAAPVRGSKLRRRVTYGAFFGTLVICQSLCLNCYRAARSEARKRHGTK